MATIKHVKTPDGTIHDISGSGGSVTYTLSKSGSTITLTGSGGDTSSVTDANTTYTLSITGHVLKLTPSSGTAQTITLPDDNTTYTLSINGSDITLTPSSGTAQTITIPNATTSSSGLMSSSDKTKLNGIEAGAEVNVQSDWNQSDSTADDYIKNKPSIPTVNNATLTIQKNGTTVETFTANSSTNKTANITVPTKTSDLTNDSDFVSDASYVHTDNNFTTTLKNKLDGIQSGAEVNVQADWAEADSSSDAYIKNKPSIPSVGDGTLTIQKNGTTIDTFTANQSSNTTVNVTVPTATSDLTNDSDFVSDSSYVHTDNNFTTTLKNKLDGIQAGAEVNVQADWTEADSTADDYIKNKPTLATVATSGDYDDLTNKPTIPTVNDGTLTIQKNGTTIDTFTANQSGNTTVNVTVPTATSDLTNDSDFVSDASYVHTDNNFTNADVTKLNGIESGAEVNVQADWTQNTATADDYIKNKPTLSTVATTGDYDDLSNKPTIPTVNDATLTIQKNGSTIDTFTANSSTNKTVNVTVPTTTSDLTNNSNFVSDASYVHTDNNFTNADVTKLNGIQAGAEVNVQSDWNQADSTADDYIQNKPVIPTVSVTQKTSIGTNIADITVNGTTTQLFAPSGGGAIEYTLSGSGDDDEYTITATPTSGTATSATIPAATQTDAGVMTATDKAKLDGIASGAEVNVQADWNESDSTSDAYIQNKPTIPTVNNATLTVQKNGTSVGTFTANASTNKTINVTVPTFDDIYPVGSIYMSVNNTNPGTLFGGTWTQIQDRFLLAAGSTYSAGATGGAATHTLTAGQLPTITSYFDIRAWGSGNPITVGTHYTSGNGTKMNNFPTNSTSVTSQRVTHTFGEGKAHNNMPPYLVVYVWQRTA